MRPSRATWPPSHWCPTRPGGGGSAPRGATPASPEHEAGRRPARDVAGSRPARPAAARIPYPSLWQRPARPHACAPISRCTTVPSRSPPQRRQRCKSFSAALIALIPPRGSSPPGQPQPAGPAAAVQRPALTAQGGRGWGSPRWRRRVCSREKWLYISYTRARAMVSLPHAKRQGDPHHAMAACCPHDPCRFRLFAR